MTNLCKSIFFWRFAEAVRLSTHHEIYSLLFPIRFARATIESSTESKEFIFVMLQCCLLPGLIRILGWLCWSLYVYVILTYLSLFLNRMNVKLFRITKKLEYRLQFISFCLQRFSTKSKGTSGTLQDIFTLDSFIDMFPSQNAILD